MSVMADCHGSLHGKLGKICNSSMLSSCVLPASFLSPDKSNNSVSSRYPNDGWELYLGYQMEKEISARAGANLLKDLQAVDKQSSRR